MNPLPKNADHQRTDLLRRRAPRPAEEFVRPTAMPSSTISTRKSSAAASFSMLFDTQIKGRMGSPSVAGSTRRLSAGTSPKSVSDTAGRPPPPGEPAPSQAARRRAPVLTTWLGETAVLPARVLFAATRPPRMRPRTMRSSPSCVFAPACALICSARRSERHARCLTTSEVGRLKRVLPASPLKRMVENDRAAAGLRASCRGRRRPSLRPRDPVRARRYPAPSVMGSRRFLSAGPIVGSRARSTNAELHHRPLQHP